MVAIPNSIFHETPAQRVALARQRYFEEGQRPSGFVSDVVLESWARCQRSRHAPHEEVEFDLVSASRTHLALQRNRQLIAAWNDEVGPLEAVLGASTCAAMLTDSTGVLIAAVCAGRSHEHIMPISTRLGVNLSEEAVGTTAPGLVIKTGKAVSVLGGEHYFDGVTPMQCAAAPIRNIHGQLAGVLDISSEHVPFNFDAAAVVSVYAASIENRLLAKQSAHHLVVKFQVSPAMIETPMVGLVGIGDDGKLAWSNGVAARLLGLTAVVQEGGIDAESLFGVGLAKLLALATGAAVSVRLVSGICVWAQVVLPSNESGRVFGFFQPTCASPVSTASVDPASQPDLPEPLHANNADMTGSYFASDSREVVESEPVSLRLSDRELIVRTVRACGGNVSQAARQLRVSRGLVYRRLREAGEVE